MKVELRMIAAGCLLLSIPSGEARAGSPWQAAGLSEKQAAAHALDRLAFGARPGEVERVAAMGVDRWLDRQLRAAEPEPVLEQKLDPFESLDLSANEMAQTFPDRGAILRQAVAAGVIEEPGMSGDGGRASATADARRGLVAEKRRAVRAWARSQGFLPQRRAHDELTAQKVLRARYAENQLREVLVDFFFNHFNVSITDPRARIYVWPYERDAIRPHVLGDFGDMLEATAKHPAMLHYLDNTSSVADGEHETTLDHHLDSIGRRGQRFKARLDQRRRRPAERRASGLNENYARELMELHTLGVEGGYGQDDVVEVARAFTGWTALPPPGLYPDVERRLSRVRRHPEAGFVVDEERAFAFRADAHDAGAKTVLGHRLAAGRGLEDGLDVLEILAAHPSTARHLAEKLAVRFIGDQPPPAVVERLAKVFERSGGDLLQVMKTLVDAPEFWAPAARGAKIKSPFELAVSALRATGAEIVHPRPIVKSIERMGQPLYAYQAPTGYPDRAEAWVNTGALLARMNFGLQFATQRISGIELDLLALNGDLEPSSLDEALRLYVPLLLPQRETAKTLERLGPMVRDPEMAKKIEASAEPLDIFDATGADTEEWEMNSGRSVDRRIRRPVPPPGSVDPSALAHVVGVILGSPEFQRR